MSEKERLHKAIFEMAKQGRLTLEKAAKQAGLSYRQAKRIYKRYKAEGNAGLIHKLRGRESNRKHPDKPKIIARYIEQNEGFDPTLAAEKLMEEDHLNVNHETLREWLLKEKLWHKQRNVHLIAGNGKAVRNLVNLIKLTARYTTGWAMVSIHVC